MGQVPLDIMGGNVEVKYFVATSTAEMVVAADLSIEARPAVIQNAFDNAMIGQLVQIPVDCADADLGDAGLNLLVDPRSSGVAFGASHCFQDCFSLLTGSFLSRQRGSHSDSGYNTSSEGSLGFVSAVEAGNTKFKKE